MKKLFLVVLIILAGVAVISASSLCFAQNKEGGTVIVYYFHGAFRCYTCNMMEKYAQEAIETYFRDDILAGKITFVPINVEEKNNEHFVQDYQLYTKALILSLVEDGKEIKSRNLQKIWQYARDKQQFSEYVVLEIESFREGAR